MKRRRATSSVVRTAGVILGLTSATFFHLASARADGSSDKVAAEALFQQGRALVAEKKFDEACKKFELSQQLDAGVGTLLYLGDCYEQAGRFASAWVTFKEAAAAAKGVGQAEREQFARAEADALEPKLSRLVVNVAPENAVDGISVRRDGVVVPRGLWSVPVPVDGGVRHIEASAPGKKPWSADFRVEGVGLSEVTVPPLVDDPSAAVAPAAPVPSAVSQSGVGAEKSTAPERAASGGTQRTIGLVLGGVGIAGLGAGAIIGLRAKSKDTEAATHCGADGLCDKQGVDLGEEAKGSANLATVLTLGGTALLATGIVLVLTAPSDAVKTAGPRLLRVGVGVGPRGPELKLGGTW